MTQICFGLWVSFFLGKISTSFYVTKSLCGKDEICVFRHRNKPVRSTSFHKALFLSFSLLKVCLFWTFNAKSWRNWCFLANITGSCGESITNIIGGVIASPGFPNSPYPDNSTCIYNIVAETGNVIAVRCYIYWRT